MPHRRSDRAPPSDVSVQTSLQQPPDGPVGAAGPGSAPPAPSEFVQLKFCALSNVFLGNHDEYQTDVQSSRVIAELREQFFPVDGSKAPASVERPPLGGLAGAAASVASTGSAIPLSAGAPTLPLATTLAAPPAPPNVPAIKIARAECPLNEFTDNARIFGGMLPFCFPFGCAQLVKASISLGARRLCLKQASNMLANEALFYFTAMNQTQRHQALQRSCKISADPRALQTIEKLLEEPDCEAKFDYAQKNPDSVEGKKLMATMGNIVRRIGANVPFTIGAQARAISTMIAQCHSFGLPSCFVRIVNDVHFV